MKQKRCGVRLIAAAAFALLVAGCAGQDRCQLTRAAQLPLTVVQRHLYTPVEVNGGSASMIVDTGSYSTLLTSEAVARLKLSHPKDTERSALGIGGYRSLASLHTGHFSVGGLGGHDLTFSVPFGDWLGMPGDGLLGMDILARFDLDFDLPARKLVLYVPAAGCNAPSAALDQPLYVLPMHQALASPNIVIYVTIDGHRLRALLDSGSEATLLFGSGVRTLGIDPAALGKDRKMAMSGVGREKISIHRHVFPLVQVGDLNVSNMPIAVSDERPVGEIDMILGMDFFTRVHLWLSFASHSVIMQYPPRPSPGGP